MQDLQVLSEFLLKKVPHVLKISLSLGLVILSVYLGIIVNSIDFYQNRAVSLLEIRFPRLAVYYSPFRQYSIGLTKAAERKTRTLRRLSGSARTVGTEENYHAIAHAPCVLKRQMSMYTNLVPWVYRCSKMEDCQASKHN